MEGVERLEGEVVDLLVASGVVVFVVVVVGNGLQRCWVEKDN